MKLQAMKHRWQQALRDMLSQRHQWVDALHVGALDGWLCCSVVLLLGLGLLMVMSTTQVLAQHRLGTPWHFVSHQFVYVGVGLLTMLVVYLIPTRRWRAWALPMMGLSCLLLVLMWVPGVGHKVNGSLRWIRIGSLQLQVCEWVKLSVIVFLADLIARRLDALRDSVAWFMKALAVVGCFAGLLLLQPDFGAAAVLVAVSLAMLFVSGVPLRPFVVMFLVLAVIMALLVVCAPYRLARLVSFLHPWSKAYSSGYQLTQSLIAFGRGGLTGLGLGHGIQKLFYLPEAHTDFLFAILVEEMGLVGGMAVIVAFVVLCCRGVSIARRAAEREQLFGAFLSLGLSLWLCLQALINMGVNMGLLPTKGLTLPFMSYGGSSLVISCWAVGLLLRVHYESKAFYG